MLINAVESEELRVAFLKDHMLDGFYIETSIAEQKVGNIYKAVVDRIDKRLQASFVNFGSDKMSLPCSGSDAMRYSFVLLRT